MLPPLTVSNLLILIALIVTIVAGVGRAPLWPAVLLIAVALLITK